jgi:predicted anti-sigma-YlaC factor YlaD
MTVCEREELVLDVLRSGRNLADTDLAAHLATCVPCTELVAVASALLDEHHVATQTSSVPTSGVVWWRMQRRAREEALRKAARTVTAVQTISIAAAIAIAIGIVGATADWRSWLPTMFHLPNMTVLAQSLPLAIALAACLALAPVALYVTLARD